VSATCSSRTPSGASSTTGCSSWLRDNPDAALAAIDAVLLSHPVIDFDNYEGSAIIENEIKQAIIDMMTGALGGDTSGIVEAHLEIVSYTDENDIDGDIG
jgi:hypothetical protein